MTGEVPMTVHVIAASPPAGAALGPIGGLVKRYGTAEAFLVAAPHEAGCVVCEVELPGLGGLELQERLRADGVRLPIVMVSVAGRVSDAVRAMRNGAVSFLRVPCPAEEIRAAVAEALERAAAETAATGSRFAALGPEEAAVLDLLLAGLPNKAVAMRLGMGLRTVERRRSAALKALGVDSLVGAAVLRNGAVRTA